MIEQSIIRKVSLVGNGAHIFAPKEWVGEEIVLIRKPRKPIRERIWEVLEPYLEDISGAFLFGSYARGEEREGSDIDLFAITNKKIKIKEKGFGVICVEEDKFKDAVNLAPVMVYSMLSEAKPIVNAGSLEKLRMKYKPKLMDFKEFLEDCERAIKINEELLKVNKEEYIDGSTYAYSLILRLRGVFIIQCLLKRQVCSYKLFRSGVQSVIKGVDFDEVYSTYLNAKANIERKRKLKVSNLAALLELLKKEVYELKNGKKKKKA